MREKYLVGTGNPGEETHSEPDSKISIPGKSHQDESLLASCWDAKRVFFFRGYSQARHTALQRQLEALS